MAGHLSRYLPRLAIRTKLIVAFVGLSIIPVVLVGWYGLHSNVRTLREIALENLTHDVATVRERSGNFLTGVKNDLVALRGSSLIGTLILQLQSRPAAALRTLHESVEPELLAFVRSKGIYYQLSLIGEDGEEITRVECADIADSASEFAVVPPAAIAGSSTDLYVLIARNLAPDQVGFAPAELRYKGDKQLPVVNFVLPLVAGSQRLGLLRASVFAGSLFSVMEPQRTLGADEKTVLVGSDGSYLYHSDLRQRWDRLIATRSEENLFKQYPPGIARTILSDSAGIIAEGIDEIIAHAPLFREQTDAGFGAGAAYEFPTSLVVFETIPAAVVMEPARRFGWISVGFLALFVASAVGLGLLATQQFIIPIGELSRGAEVIARGNYDHRLVVETGDEIERLAEQFNAMAAALASHEEELASHRLRLEELVQLRTGELVAEKGKLQAILDNVQSAFVLLDGSFRIQTASAAFSAITGFQLADVQGGDFREICARGGSFCTAAWAEAICRSRKTDVHLDRMPDGHAGTERFIEHVTIPVVQEGVIASMVTIMTDVTQRKRLERQLIQSEKLMATGEMSAIIAHEFRNALTSIKMILQLQHEARTLSRENRASLEVALDSIGHMESIVEDLLNFARPSPLEFRAERIDRLIDECRSFVQLRIHKERITLEREIAADLPPIVVDAQRFKEALINLLLNAIQAIEGDGAEAGRQKIRISANRAVLTKTIREFCTPDVQEGGEQAQGNEIVLRKGAECVVIGISDTGPGISRGILGRIFDPFFTTKSNGTGLGLPMVKRTINAHGGVVAVRTTRGKGTTFEIVLPLPKGDEEGNGGSIKG